MARLPRSISNRGLAIVNAAALSLGFGLSDPGTVLPVLLQELRASNLVIGLLPAIRFGAFLLPQLFVASYLQSRSTRKPIVVLMGLVRAVAYAAIGLMLLSLGGMDSSVAIAVLLLIFGLTRVMAGSAALARTDVIGKAIPREGLARFFAVRGFWSDSAGLLAGVLVAAILGSGLGVPLDYSVLFFLGAGLLAVAAVVFHAIREKPSPTTGEMQTPASQLRAMRGIARSDGKHVRYVLYRLFLRLSGLANPFYIVYATAVWHVSPAMAGARLVANLWWRRLAEKRGIRSVLVISTVAGLVVPLAVTALALWDTLGPATVGVSLATGIFLLVYLSQGLTGSGRMIANNAILLTIAPERQRPSYIGFLNTILGITALLPAAAGWSIDSFGYLSLFVLALGFYVVAWQAATSLRDAQAA